MEQDAKAAGEHPPDLRDALHDLDQAKEEAREDGFPVPCGKALEQARQLVNTQPGSGLNTAGRLFALSLSTPATAAPAHAQAPMDDPPVPTCFMVWNHDPCSGHQRNRHATQD